MTKETFTVPAYEVTVERTERKDRVLLGGRRHSVSSLRDAVGQLGVHPAFKTFYTAALAYLDANKPDPKPGFTVRHEVDGEWKWTAVFSQSDTWTAAPWHVTQPGGLGEWATREDFAFICERDGVTL